MRKVVHYTRKWDLEMEVKGQWPAARSFHTTGVGKRVVVMGGREQNNNHLADFHIFDTETKEWLQPSVSGDIPKQGDNTLVQLLETSLYCMVDPQNLIQK
ncbi:uncharacterized protein LOC128559010 [Mercenaria mercenaria]|uniref:uncharacterized protein LOC128559010 n=1 Tax=Mercenaria mercenaria TaxID=6596 RepID=UPI00234F60F7|nr:uncharacterized protein LOC128559010 [Mercenaria mercenaria]